MDNLQQTSAQILALLRSDSSVDTALQIKLKLRISSSALYMALGFLAAENKIEISQQGIDYKINLKG